jgi:formiminotetrahydrofolate cyclodeaminase
MSLENLSVSEFTKALASKQSVPGGGGASALAASIGVALGSMVGEFTVGKKKYADVEADIYKLMEEAEALRVQLLACIEEDAVAFEPLSKAYGIPKDDPTRNQVLEDCLKQAAAVPFKILELACKAVDLQRDFADKGSKLMISDAATGAAILSGAIKGAALNVKVNTGLMKDKEYAKDLEDKVDHLVDTYVAKAEEIYEDVEKRL